MREENKKYLIHYKICEIQGGHLHLVKTSNKKLNSLQLQLVIFICLQKITFCILETVDCVTLICKS